MTLVELLSPLVGLRNIQPHGWGKRDVVPFLPLSTTHASLMRGYPFYHSRMVHSNLHILGAYIHHTDRRWCWERLEACTRPSLRAVLVVIAVHNGSTKGSSIPPSDYLKRHARSKYPSKSSSDELREGERPYSG
jgi:hypothetical protein